MCMARQDRSGCTQPFDADQLLAEFPADRPVFRRRQVLQLAGISDSRMKYFELLGVAGGWIPSIHDPIGVGGRARCTRHRLFSPADVRRLREYNRLFEEGYTGPMIQALYERDMGRDEERPWAANK